MTGCTMVRDDAALHALQPEWDALWHRVPGASPFQHPGWLLPWWRQFGTGQPRAACIHHAGGLAGILPLYVLDEGAPRLLPIGAGTSDHLDALLEPGVPVDALLHPLLAEGYPCDLIEMPPGAALLSLSAPPGWRATWRDDSPCPVLTLPGTVEALSEAIPAHTLRKLRMNRNRAERAGGASVETATADTLAPLLAELVRLHQARWTDAGETGAFADPRVVAHLAEAVPALLAAGLLRLQAVRLDGTVAAATLALLAPGRILFYLSGYDSARAFESPGTLLLGAMLEEALREGRREADFLRGGEAYKYAWGGADRRNRACRLERL